MKSIVAPVNFTANSENAACYAADLALAMHARLHLFHAFQIPVSVSEIPMPEYVFEELHNGAIQSLSDLKDQLVKRAGGKLDISTHMEIGGIEHGIEEYCRIKNPFVVVMGSSGHSLERVFSGSQLPAAIRRLTYPLIIVPSSIVFHEIRNIVLACDLDDMAGGIPLSISFLKELKDHFACRFYVINVCTGRQDRQSEAESTFLFNSWKERLQEAYPEVHFLKMYNVEQGIDEYINTHPVDLLMVFPKHHGVLEFHRSHSKRLALHCNVPIMSIHA